MRFVVVALSTVFLISAELQAAPLNLRLLGAPDIVSQFIDVAYDASTDTLTATGYALALDEDTSTPSTHPITGGTFELIAPINAAGELGAGGTLKIGGTIPTLGFNSGVILTGALTEFGFRPSGGDPLEFMFDVTGGDAALMYANGRGGVILAGTSFPGSFANDFDNLADGPGTGNGMADVGLIACVGGRVSTSVKGSVLVYSKVEIKWDAFGNLTQDTFIDIANDYDGDGVDVQAYYINGDIALDEIRTQDGTITRDAEPGWNMADCRFRLTKNQPHYWSAARGGSQCPAFTVLDEDGPGRPDPHNPGGRILRGFILAWAVRFSEDGNRYEEIRWNHLKGDGLVVNYEEGSAWEYNAWAFQTNCARHGEPPLSCVRRDESGACLEAGLVPGRLDLDGFEYDSVFDQLLLDFYATGSNALSQRRSDGSISTAVMVETDLTLHSLDVDLRQDGLGPLLTKATLEVFNENEVKLSGLRRCICCWDQTFVSEYPGNTGVPNYFLRERLGTDKGMARIDGVSTVEQECNYCDVCGIEPRDAAIEPAAQGSAAGLPDFFDACELSLARDTPLLGLAIKLLTFERGDEKVERAGMSLVGIGSQSATILHDVPGGTEELRPTSAGAVMLKEPNHSSGRDKGGR